MVCPTSKNGKRKGKKNKRGKGKKSDTAAREFEKTIRANQLGGGTTDFQVI